jgi:GntR family transcriptional repressor for pyruvate dehydrogenase complex
MILKRQSLADQVASALVTMIVEQNLPPGETLPSATELAERFGVSRTVVREALAALAGRGIIDHSQGRESVVSTPGHEHLQELLGFRIQRDGVEPEALTEVRQSIEVLGAQLAAERKTDETLADMSAALDRLAAATTDDEFHEADIAFHRALAVASKNPIIVLVLDALSGLMRDLRRRYFRGHEKRGRTPAMIVAEHRAIYDAIAKGSAKAATNAMLKHLQASQADLTAAGS